jgi:hypothetical protein
MNHRRLVSKATRFVLLFALSALPFAARAQTATATLSGTIVDQNGAIVPGVRITVLNEATSLRRETSTNESGSFTVPLLPPGRYTLTGMHDGFRAVVVNNVVLNVGDEKALKIDLKVGDVNETVNITGEESLINESPAVATVVDRKFVENIPLNSRSFQSLLLLTPGAVLVPVNGPQAGQFSVNGQRADTNYWWVWSMASRSLRAAAIPTHREASPSIRGRDF